MMTGKNHSAWIKTSPTITLPNANSTRTVLGLNLGLHGAGPLTVSAMARPTEDDQRTDALEMLIIRYR
jgi:hypothetical protein